MMTPSTPENPVNIEDWEKWFPEFETRGDPQLEKMKQESLRFGREAFDWQSCRTTRDNPYPTRKSEFKPRWLSLLGTSGTGKTMLARQVGRRLGYSVFKLWLDIAASVRAGNHQEFLDLCDKDILIVDDVFSEYRTEYSDAKLCEFFIRREYKWTMITANVSMEAIAEKYDQRIASRMIRHSSVVVDVDLPDWNLRAASNLNQVAPTTA